MEKKKIFVNVKLRENMTKHERSKVGYLAMLNNRYKVTGGGGIYGFDYNSKVEMAEYIAYITDESGDIIGAACLKDPNYSDEVGDNYLEKMMLDTGIKLTDYKEMYLMSIDKRWAGHGISKLLANKLKTVQPKIYYVSNLDLIDVTQGLIRDNFSCIYTYLSPYTNRVAAIWVNELEEGMLAIEPSKLILKKRNR